MAEVPAINCVLQSCIRLSGFNLKQLSNFHIVYLSISNSCVARLITDSLPLKRATTTERNVSVSSSEIQSLQNF
jgi:hypothetical protein